MHAKSDIKTIEAITAAIDMAVQKALDALGIATKNDINDLKVRIEKLEASLSAPLIKRKPGRPLGSKNKKKAAGKSGSGKRAAKKAAVKASISKQTG
jgi:hypothetical protein